MTSSKRSSWWRRPLVWEAALTLFVLGGITAFVLFRDKPEPPRRPGPSVAGDAYSFVESLNDPTLDLQTRLDRLPEIMKYAEYITPPSVTASPATAHNYLEYQVFTKVVRVNAEFDLLEGKRAEALQQLASLYYMGQLMQREGLHIAGIIGTAIQAIALGGLENTVLNISETTESRKLAWETLDDLDARTLLPSRKALSSKLSLTQRYFMRGNVDEALIRQQTVFAKLRLLRGAVAALDRLSSSGDFPKSSSEFGPLLPVGPEIDPFSDPDGPLLFGGMGKDFNLWSVGPDKISQSGSVMYDPTNGTVSAGDIVIEVRRDRKYSFPTSGTAVKGSEISALFPAGLPRDTFADRRSRTYGLTSSPPVMVYSFGPDTDQSAHAGGSGPEVLYDPTNGVVSDGDIWRALPE